MKNAKVQNKTLLRVLVIHVIRRTNDSEYVIIFSACFRDLQDTLAAGDEDDDDDSKNTENLEPIQATKLSSL